MTNSALEQMALDVGYNMQNIFAIAPQMMEQLARQSPLSYNNFVNQIDKDLNRIISNTESGRQHHLVKGEDAITEHIIVQLKQIYPSVHHDAQQGGHCDMYIEVNGSNNDLYKWIMEAKLWKGFDYVYKGLDEQLLGSYAVGGENNCKGGMIFYSNKKSGASHFMKEWYTGLNEYEDISVGDMREDGLRFDTTHQLNGGKGADFHVNHYCIELYHEPTQQKIDKAEAKAKANK
jgi:hypothetical protein